MKTRQRIAFEEWISDSPHEWDTARYPNTFAQAGQYRDPKVQLAWEAWEEAQSQIETDY